MLVPERVRYLSGMGHAEWMSTPGPAMSTFPEGFISLLEKLAMVRFSSKAATAKIEGQSAGLATGLYLSRDRLLWFPAAATSTAPLERAKRAARSYAMSYA